MSEVATSRPVQASGWLHHILHLTEHSLAMHLTVVPHHVRRHPHMSVAVGSEGREKTDHRARNPFLFLLVLCLGCFMILLDSTIVNIAFPT